MWFKYEILFTPFLLLNLLLIKLKILNEQNL